jgi:hypothetical protein
MATQFDVYMVAPPRPLGEAVERVLVRFRALGMVLSGRLLSLAEPEEELNLGDGWKDVANTWSGIAFSAHRCGPSLHVAIDVTKDRCLAVHAFFSHKLLEQLFSEQTERPCFYAPLVQLAAGLEARFALGEYELDFEAQDEEQVCQAIWAGPRGTGDPSWFALIRQDALSRSEIDAKAADAFVITEWLAGYWMLEHRDYLSFYHRR